MQLWAKLYSQPGVTLGLLGRNMNKLESVANLCKEKGAVAIPVSIDVTDTSKLQQWIVDFNSKHPVDFADCQCRSDQ